MNTIQRFLLAALAALAVAVPLYGTEEPVRCIVILKHRTSAAPDVVSLGGAIESRQDEQLVITVPAGAVAELKADPAVLYIEEVGGEPERDERSLVGLPSEPEPGAAGGKRHFAPQPLGSTTKDLGVYSYDGAGNIYAIGTDNYVYDGAQRLVQSSTMGVTESYAYDGFGNMKTRTNRIIPTPDPATNRYGGSSYNEIGAVTGDGTYTISYDAVGQPLKKEFSGCTNCTEYYVYSASDERIGVQHGGWWYWSLRDEGGKVLRQYRGSTSSPSAPLLWLEDFVWRDGLLLGSNRPVEMGGRRHFHLDHQGTPRLITSDNSAQMVSQHDYYPFGDEETPVVQETAGGFDREEPMTFTGHERDCAGGFGAEDSHCLTYMHARYYSPGSGRFLSPDPVLGDPYNPQTWNRYAYARNNPMRYTDPTGLTDDDHKWDVSAVLAAFSETYDFVEGAANGWSSSMLYNANRVEPRDFGYAAGQVVGDAVALGQDVKSTVSGVGLISGSGALEAVTGGASTPVSVPAAVGGAALVLQGTTGAVQAAHNLQADISAASQMSRTRKPVQLGRDRPGPNERYHVKPGRQLRPGAPNDPKQPKQPELRRNAPKDEHWLDKLANVLDAFFGGTGGVN